MQSLHKIFPILLSRKIQTCEWPQIFTNFVSDYVLVSDISIRQLKCRKTARMAIFGHFLVGFFFDYFNFNSLVEANDITS